jgi:acyl carrier protein
MKSEEIIPRIGKVICAELNIEPFAFRRETTFIEIEGWDSLSCTTVMLALEKEFHTRIPYLRARALENVGGMADLLCEIVQEG